VFPENKIQLTPLDMLIIAGTGLFGIITLIINLNTNFGMEFMIASLGSFLGVSYKVWYDYTSAMSLYKNLLMDLLSSKS